MIIVKPLKPKELINMGKTAWVGRYMENLKEESVYKTVPATNLRYFSSTDC
jgi:hypothetical protein